jgi:hypothetical protein
MHNTDTYNKLCNISKCYIKDITYNNTTVRVFKNIDISLINFYNNIFNNNNNLLINYVASDKDNNMYYYRCINNTDIEEDNIKGLYIKIVMYRC